MDGLQEVDGPSISLKTNTILHAQDSSHHKYGIVARTGNAMDENRAHKSRTLFIPTKERDYDAESCSEDESTWSIPMHQRGKTRHSNKYVYNSSHPISSRPANRNTEREIKELHSKQLSSPPPSYSHVHSADLLRRLQRLEELQHVASMKVSYSTLSHCRPCGTSSAMSTSKTSLPMHRKPIMVYTWCLID